MNDQTKAPVKEVRYSRYKNTSGKDWENSVLKEMNKSKASCF